MHRGFAKLWRKSLDSCVWSSTPEVWKVWCWCLMRANHKDTFVHEKPIRRGEFVTGRFTGSEECYLKPSVWYRAMQKLSDFEMITLKTHNKFTIVSVCNYEIYNDEKEQDAQQADSKCTTSGQQADTDKNKQELKETTKSVNFSDEIQRVFSHYRKLHPRSFPKPNSETKEWKKIADRMKEGYTVESLCEAIDGNHRSPHHCGENESKTEYHGLELIVRDANHVEMFLSVPAAKPKQNQFIFNHGIVGWTQYTDDGKYVIPLDRQDAFKKEFPNGYKK